jgi:flavodoxin I
MKVVVIYDSKYGNTEKIAQALEQEVEKHDQGKLLTINDVSQSEIRSADLILVGSPTQGGAPTKSMKQFLESLPQDALEGKLVAAFDTRFDDRVQKLFLRLLMKLIGYASPRISTRLQSKGGELASDPVGFIVQDKAGPLKQGEIERATIWVDDILETAHVTAS